MIIVGERLEKRGREVIPALRAIRGVEGSRLALIIAKNAKIVAKSGRHANADHD